MTSLDFDVAELKFVELGGYRMAYREWGDTVSSRAVVLVHGITSSSLSWVRVAPRLAARARVIAIDLKGHGDSGQPRSGYLFADQAREIAGLGSQLGLERVMAVGHSWGGAIALELAVHGSLPVDRLVLEDPAVGQSSMTPAETARRDQVKTAFVSSVGVSPEVALQGARANLALGWTEQDVAGKVDAAVKTSPASVQAVFDENGVWDVSDLLAEVRCPTLLVRAKTSNGGVVSHAALERASTNPLVTVVTLADADHNIHRGRFEAFMAKIEPFLNVDGASAYDV